MSQPMPNIQMSLSDRTLGFQSVLDKEERDVANKAPFLTAARNSLDMIHAKALKAGVVPLFRRCFDRYQSHFQNARSIVELGGGWGWASYYVKWRVPQAKVYTTDIAGAIVERHTEWRDFFQTEIDGAYCAKSYELPFEPGSIDLAFCFQSAHHFGRHRSTFKELQRVLRPGGIALYLDEPVCGRMLYKAAHKRVNRRIEEDGVMEDVLIHRELLALARETGFDARIEFDTHTINRGAIETLYYFALSRLGPLKKILPAGASFVFRKPEGSVAGQSGAH
jgi:SAM-dependent methyltransferase